MSFVKSQINELLTTDSAGFLKELTRGLEPYLEYYSLLCFENTKDFIESINHFSFFTIRGACGAGKSSFRNIIKNSFASNIKLFEYNCSEITELDDIFFTFYKFMLQNPIKREIFRNLKSNFKPSSIDEQIMNYLKRCGDIVLILDNFEKLLNENGELKAENIKSFIELISTLKNIKVLLFTTTNIKSSLDIPVENIKEIRLNGLDEEQIKDFLAIFKVDVPQSLHKEIYDLTNGYIYSLKFLANSQKVLNLPITAILKERASTNLPLNAFLAKKIIAKLSPSSKKALFYFAIFRHEINENILKGIEHFEDASKEIEILRNYMLLEGEKNYEIRDFLKKLILEIMSDREKLKFHEKIANFYAEQIPMKPNERIIEISRTSMYSEKFYHYNMQTKLAKNFELQSTLTTDTLKTSDNKLDSQKIKYIASTKYLPDFEIKQEDDSQKQAFNYSNKEKPIKIEIDEEINLTEEEKEILGNDKILATPELNKMEDESAEENFEFNEEFTEKLSEIKEEDNENEKGKNLLKKGLKFFREGKTNESISYLRNAMSLLQNNDSGNFYIAKLTLAKALSDNFKYNEAKENLLELSNLEINSAMKTDIIIELAIIDEYEHKLEDAMAKYNNALNIAQKANLKSTLAKIYFRIALLFDDLNDMEKALYHYLLAATDATETNNKIILASAYSNIASIYEERGDTNKAIEYYNKSLKADELARNYEGQAKSLSNLGNIFFSKNNNNLATKIFIKATQAAKKTGDKYLIASSYLELGDTFLHSSDYKNALKAYLLAKRNIDSTISTDSKNKIERRFDMIVEEIGENAYNFLMKELRKNA